MNQIIILDELDHHYTIRENLENIQNISVNHAESLEDLRLKIYEIDPDLLIYYIDILTISIHDIIALLLDTECLSLPIMIISKLPQHFISPDHEQIFGPYHSDMNFYTLKSTVENLIKYRKLNQSQKILKEENERLRHGVLSKHEEELFKDASFFKIRVLQEIKKAKRFNHPLALCLITLDQYGELKKQYNENIVKRFMKALISSIKEVIRDTDIPMNYTENKIMILMPLTDSDGLNKAVERLRTNIIRTQYQEGGYTLSTTATFGSALMDKKTPTFSSMVKKANNPE